MQMAEGYASRLQHFRFLESGEVACAVAANSLTLQEAFTYIDKMLEDEASFRNWLSEREKLERGVRNDQQKALASMLQHPLFPEFCKIVGAEPGEWGQESQHADYEVSIFEEFLVERERKKAEASIPAPTEEELKAIRAADFPANAETQVALSLHDGAVACFVYLELFFAWCVCMVN